MISLQQERLTRGVVKASGQLIIDLSNLVLILHGVTRQLNDSEHKRPLYEWQFGNSSVEDCNSKRL